MSDLEQTAIERLKAASADDTRMVTWASWLNEEM